MHRRGKRHDDRGAQRGNGGAPVRPGDGRRDRLAHRARARKGRAVPAPLPVHRHVGEGERRLADRGGAGLPGTTLRKDCVMNERPPFITRGNDALWQRRAARRTAGNRGGRRSACRSAQRRAALSPVLSDHRWPSTIGEHLLVIRQNARTESCRGIVRLGTERRVARRLASDADPPPERAWRRR